MSGDKVTDQQQQQQQLPAADKYTLKWNDHQTNITESIVNWRESGKFLDVTLVCEDGSCFDVHKIVLCVSSEYLESMLKDNPCDHPMIILKGVEREQLSSILNFIYTGEIQLEQGQLEDFLSITQSLKIKGLTDTMQMAGNVKEPVKEEPRNHVSSILIQALEQGKEKRAASLGLEQREQSMALEEASSEDDSTRYDDEEDDEEMDDLNRIGFQGLAGLLAGGLNSNSSQESSFGQQNNQHRLDLLRVRATDPRPCPKCGKIYRSAHTLRTHLEDKHTLCPGYRCVLCGTVAKSRNSLHSHMSRQHRGISTKDLPVLPMPSPFDPGLAARLISKSGNGNNKFGDIFGSGHGEHRDGGKKENQPTTSSTAIIKPNSSNSTASTTGSAILDTYLHFIAENSMAALASSLGYQQQMNHYQPSNTNDKNTGNNKDDEEDEDDF